MSVPKTRPDVSEDAPASDAHAPRPRTLAENITATLKLLAGMGVVGAALWMADLWIAAR
jgi:hypothetical protein